MKMATSPYVCAATPLIPLILAGILFPQNLGRRRWRMALACLITALLVVPFIPMLFLFGIISSFLVTPYNGMVIISKTSNSVAGKKFPGVASESKQTDIYIDKKPTASDEGQRPNKRSMFFIVAEKMKRCKNMVSGYIPVIKNILGSGYDFRDLSTIVEETGLSGSPPDVVSESEAIPEIDSDEYKKSVHPASFLRFSPISSLATPVSSPDLNLNSSPESSPIASVDSSSLVPSLDSPLNLSPVSSPVSPLELSPLELSPVSSPVSPIELSPKISPVISGSLSHIGDNPAVKREDIAKIREPFHLDKALPSLPTSQHNPNILQPIPFAPNYGKKLQEKIKKFSDLASQPPSRNAFSLNRNKYYSCNGCSKKCKVDKNGDAHSCLSLKSVCHGSDNEFNDVMHEEREKNLITSMKQKFKSFLQSSSRN